MTKRSKQNNICMILFAILEIFTMIGAYAAHHYTKARLGMMRHVVYLNSIWEDMLPIQSIRWILVVIIIILGLFICLRFRKQKTKPIIGTIIFIWTIAISVWTTYFLIAYDAEWNRAYYILGICFVAITIFQNILGHCFLNKRTE